MRAYYVEYVVQEQSSFTLWRTLLCERAYESAKRMSHAKMVEVLNSNSSLPKVQFITDLFVSNTALPCGVLLRNIKESQINRIKRWGC